ncbi:LysR family transcriptional regulator [Crossiella sp. CA198]|uniref:LysR family transcriptional regulator n=1 Tax=Crossiella sp. CA198 TaxID=3455607 RepID=UPI003F8D5FC3
MELREIEAFLVLAEELHFGRTAARLHLTQGRVSQTIRTLEREIGGALFERTSRSVRLTGLGKEFLAGARTGHEQLLTTLRACQVLARGVNGTLRVGYHPSMGLDFVTGLVRAFEARHPRCAIQLNATEIGPDLLPVFAGAQVVLTWSPGDPELLRDTGLGVGPVLARHPRALVTPADHPLARGESICVEDLAGHLLCNPTNSAPPAHRAAWTPVVTPSGRPIPQTSDDLCALTGKTSMLVDDALILVARGVGLHCSVAGVLDRMPFPGLVAVPIRDLPPMLAVPVWHQDSAAVRAFVDLAAELAPID